ncbi:MAG: hypothetical protein HOU81_11485 [Hamadaea sp.]|uniref:MGH1-like glycoside hydrolase domain-containing protein n=1 Tax=Hamadaea sp. TaxID=2024425 RepID=UPI0017C425F6|nr:trehalase family glycosidase [Hamadaea sp.]NUR71434.1 hypothetical protein [Hamadaea sp.]NUT23744.1 hypothetical protein [Hamadaea sp.]
MTEHHPVPNDWNTWDTQYHTAAAHLPSGLRIRAAIVAPDGTVTDGFTWREGLERLGHHTVDGEYAEVTVRAGEALLRLVFTNPAANVLTGLAELLPGTPDGTRVRLIVDKLPSVDSVDLDRGQATFPEGSDVGDGVVTLPGHGGTFAWAPVGVSAPAVDFEAAKAAAESRAIGSSGWLGRSAEGYQRALTWNTVIRTDLARVITPTSRDFVHAGRRGFYGTWALHGWDTFFCGLTATWIDHDYARGIYDQMLEQATDRGMVPNRVSDERGRTDDRSQPPVGAYTVFKSYLSSGLSDETRNLSLLTGAYEALLGWHDWWTRDRVGPLGLLTWGSDPTGDPKSATVDSTRRESGMDDSPMFDEIQYDPKTHTMDLTDVALTALHAADAEALAAIAARLGFTEVAARLRDQLAGARTALEERFWDADAGHYRNLRADGSFDIHLAPSMLYPLLAGSPSPERARQAVETLLTPSLLGGTPPLPSVSRSDPGYNRHYMRGRVWGPVAFLAVEGLRRYALDDHVDRIVDELLSMFRVEWEEHSHVHENYFSSPDEDIHPFEARSDFLLSWGNLLAYLAMQQLADPRPDGWRFAHPGRAATLTNLALSEGRLHLYASDRLRVTLDSTLLVDGDSSTVVSSYSRSSTVVSAVVSSDGPVRLGVPSAAGTTVRVQVGSSPVLTVGVGDDRTVEVAPIGGRVTLTASSQDAG